MYISDKDSKLLLEMRKLSMVDVFILQHLLKYSEDTLRFKILEDMNSQLPKEYQMSPTKFYYSLDRLVEEGYIDIIDGGKKRSGKIRTKKKIQEIFKAYITNLSYAHLDMGEIMEDLVNRFFAESKLDTVNNALIFLDSQDTMIDSRKLKAFSNYMNHLYLLCSEKEFERYIGRNPNSLLYQTKTIDSKIREANDFFDVILILESVDRLDKTLLVEAVRTLKKNGIVIISTMQPVSKIGHILADHALAAFHDDGSFEELKSYMFRLLDDIGLKNSKQFEHNGFYMVWAVK